MTTGMSIAFSGVFDVGAEYRLPNSHIITVGDASSCRIEHL